jgi:hypothetical protein
LLDLAHDEGIQRQQVAPAQQALRCVRPTDDLAQVVVEELAKRQILFRKMSPGRWQER